MRNPLSTRPKKSDVAQTYAEFLLAAYTATLGTLTQHLPLEASRIVASTVTLEELFGH